MENSQFPLHQHSEMYSSFPVYPNFSVPPPSLYPPGPIAHHFRHSNHHAAYVSQASEEFMGPFHGEYSPVHPEHSQHNAANCTSEDKLWVEHFLSSIGKTNSNSMKICDAKTDKISICEARECVSSSICIVKELKQLETEMSDDISVLSQNEWNNKMSIIDAKKNHLIKNLNTFSKSTLDSLALALKKRKKKRATLKRQCAIWKQAKMEARSRRQQMHRTIDSWLEEMKCSVERVKTEESLKQQADIVLADVTRKQAEARRQTTLLAKLLKLHQLRAQGAVVCGERVSVEQAQIFDNKLHHLQELWNEQVRGYNLEEKGLRVMLEEESQVKKKPTSSLQHNFRKWWKLLFGEDMNYENSYTMAERDVDSFVAIRRDWDRFLAPADAPMASSLPVGWVVPTRPSSADWEQLLASNHHGDVR